jgi:hypothetical protein
VLAGPQKTLAIPEETLARPQETLVIPEKVLAGPQETLAILPEVLATSQMVLEITYKYVFASVVQKVAVLVSVTEKRQLVFWVTMEQVF